MHAQISRAYHGWKTPFHYWKFHCPWQTPVGYVGPVTTHANGLQQSAKENPFGLVMRSVTNVMVFDTVIPPGYSIGL